MSLPQPIIRAGGRPLEASLVWMDEAEMPTAPMNAAGTHRPARASAEICRQCQYEHLAAKTLGLNEIMRPDELATDRPVVLPYATTKNSAVLC